MSKINPVRPIRKLPSQRGNSFRLNIFQKVLLTLALLIAVVTTLPVMVVLLIGLLPTFTIMITDKNNTNKLIIVGCFNLAGVFIYLFHVISNFTIRDAFFIFSDIFNLIIMLGSAGLGLVVMAQKRLKTIDEQLNKLAEDWGEGIKGNGATPTI